MTESQSPYTAPVPPSPASRRAAKIGWAEIFAIAIIVAVLVMILVPAIQHGHSPSRRTACRNNLKQIGLALHNYHDAYGTFPPAVLSDRTGRPLHSWRVLILPFLEQEVLYEKIRLHEPWDSPHNQALHRYLPDCYRCPAFGSSADTETPSGNHLQHLTTYSAVSGPGAAFDGVHPRQISDFKDGTFNTLMVAEVHRRAVHWMSPHDVAPIEMLTELRQAAGQNTTGHVDGINSLMADGSIRFLPARISPSTLKALCTVAGDDDVPEEFDAP